MADAGDPKASHLRSIKPKTSQQLIHCNIQNNHLPYALLSPPFLDFHLSTLGMPASEFHSMPANVSPTLPLHQKNHSGILPNETQL